jgi:hypothetical protein
LLVTKKSLASIHGTWGRVLDLQNGSTTGMMAFTSK